MGKILFIRGGAVGDFILTLPAIQLAREQLPDAEIEVLGYPPITRLAEAAGLADGTRSIEYGPLSSFFIPNGVLAPELIDYFQQFSVVFSYLYDPDGFFTQNLERAGVETLYHGPHRIDESLTGTPAAAQLAKPLESLALFLDKPHVTLAFDCDSSEAADAFLAEQNSPMTEQQTWIALHPGSGSPRKNWSFEGWIEVARKLHAADPERRRFFISSGEAEDKTISEFLSLLKAADLPCLHAAHLPLPVVGSLLQRCALYLGHDSGISHLAAACGIPGVLLFGPTDPQIWAPQNPGIRTVIAPDADLSLVDPDYVVGQAEAILGS